MTLSQPVVASTPAERVATVSYRLQTRAATYCSDLSPTASFLIADERSSRVEIVVPDAPAARAGLKVGDIISAINGHATADANVADRIDDALDHRTMTLALSDLRQVIFTEQLGCGFAVGMEESARIDSYADGKAVAVSSALVAFTNSDDELAVMIGHELAHNILKHKAILDAEHVSRGAILMSPSDARRIRQTEEEADVMALYLMQAAAYDIDVAPAFWQRFGTRDGAALISDGTHPRTKARVALAAQTIATIRAQHARGEPLTPHFNHAN